MSTWVIVIIIIAAVAAVVLIALLVWEQMQRRRLRDKFGPEYERTVKDQESPRAADRELTAREKRHEKFDIKPLSPSAHERYTQQWSLIQVQFVDRPSAAVAEADRVLVELMAERGYPTEGYEQQLADLSVRHSRTLKHYRAAHETMQGQEETQKSTEELRHAMVRYRIVFEDLLTDGADDGRAGDHRDRKARTDASNGGN